MRDCPIQLDETLQDVLLRKINKALWWHVTPSDPRAYAKRGKFLASTYNQASFYGRPNDVPERVHVARPVYGFREIEILEQLFPGMYTENDLEKMDNDTFSYAKRVDFDAKMYRKAKKLGYDAIVLLTPAAMNELKLNRKPRSIELNLC